MAKKEIILCDTDVLINYLKGDEKTKKAFALIGMDNIAFSIITCAEIYKGASSKVEFELLKRTLEKYTIYPLNEDISDIFNGHIINYTLSHRIGIPDALIAATAVSLGLKLFMDIPSILTT